MIFGHIRLSQACEPARQPGPTPEVLAAHQQLHDLQEQLDKLTLVCMAMWELLKDKGGVAEDELVAKVALLDARDGVADGKLTRTVRPCAQCGRPVSVHHRRCLYCGREEAVASVFESL